jgi:hypothetical protein
MTATIQHRQWNLKQGQIAVTWSAADYEGIRWIPLPPLEAHETNKGFRAHDGAYQIYGERISGWTPDFQQAGVGTEVPDAVARVFDPVRDLFGLDKMIYSLGRYSPGQILPWHRDLYPTYRDRNNIDDPERVVRIIVLLHDPAPGQQLWIQDQFCGGRAGSWFSWQGATSHMAANLSEQDRYMMQITGVVS